MKIWDANPKITEFLHERGALVSRVPYTHSYPICWRCKNPVIFRATAQWFIAMDRRGFREKALSEIQATRWIPAWGEDRIRNMIAARPDWCISRQRLWGVPIPAAYCVACEEPHLDASILSRVADRFDQEGADAWFARDIADFLPEGFKCRKCSGTKFRREDDILDVWFDSGSLHAALEAHPDRKVSAIADLYLEGSDQHRGWFHSSLLVSVGTRDHAPFKAVLTHGFTVDGEGRKMSKSLGNTVEADKAIKQYGADVLRLWVSMVDFREDMRISDELLKRVAEAYRKVRNTCRFLLSNLFDFDPSAGHEVTEPLDQYALAVHYDFEAKIRAAYEEHDYHALHTLLVQYCTVDLSAFYMDVLKDRLYCDAADGPRRRSAQAAMFRIADGLARYMAPLLVFTGDEIYESLHKAEPGTVHERVFPDRGDSRRRGARGLEAAARGAGRRAEDARDHARGEDDRVLARGRSGSQGIRRGAGPAPRAPGVTGSLPGEPGESLHRQRGHARRDRERDPAGRGDQGGGRQVLPLLDLLARKGGRGRGGSARRLVSALLRGGRGRERPMKPVVLPLSIVAIDQATKLLVIQRLPLYEDVPSHLGASEPPARPQLRRGLRPALRHEHPGQALPVRPDERHRPRRPHVLRADHPSRGAAPPLRPEPGDRRRHRQPDRPGALRLRGRFRQDVLGKPRLAELQRGRLGHQHWPRSSGHRFVPAARPGIGRDRALRPVVLRN